MEQFVEFARDNMFLSAAWVILALMLVYSLVSSAFSPIKELGTHEVTQLINREDAILLDIRTAADFKKGHIIGARQLKAEEVREANFSRLEKSKDKPIVVVCNMGISAKKTAAQLLKAGYSRVSVLKGGMGAWQSANLPVAK